MRYKYKKAWQMARWLAKALDKAHTAYSRDAAWQTYERSSWLMDISYGLAFSVRKQLSNRNRTTSFMCRACYKTDVPMPISAVQVISGQRIGRSCNYWRCTCGTINRHIWVTGYPTRYECGL